MAIRSFRDWQQEQDDTGTGAPIATAPASSGGLKSFKEWSGQSSSVVPEVIEPSAPKENIFNKALDVGKSYLSNVWNTYKATPSKIYEDIDAASKDMQQGHFIKGAAKAGFRTAADAANAIFAPISAAIGTILETTGGQKLQDDFGQTIADKNGISNWPAFQKFAMEHPNAGEDFTRLLTLIMSKGEKGKIEPSTMLDRIHDTSSKIVASAKTEPTTVPVKSEGVETKVPVSTPKGRYEEYRKSQGYEPYISHEELPTIEMGAKPKSDLPTIQLEEGPKTGRLTKGDYTYEPIKEVKTPFTPEELSKIVPEKSTPTEKAITPGETIETPKAAKTAEPELPTTRSDKLFTAAIEKKLIDSADVESVDRVRENAGKWSVDAETFIKENPDNYLDVALGKKSHPNAEAIYTAAEIKAVKEGDVSTIFKLSESTVPTEAGRGLKKLDSSDPNSPVKIVRDIKKAREEAAGKTLPKSKKPAKAREEVVKKGKAEEKTTRMKIADAQSLLNKLIC